MSKTNKKPTAGPASFRAPRDPERARRVRRVVLHGLGVILLVAGCGALFVTLRGYVETRVAEPTAIPAIRFKIRPAWMTDLVARQLAASLRPTKGHSLFDRDVLVELHRRIEGNPWIAQVRQIRREFGDAPGDTIEVDCDFRAPIALVRWHDAYWFVDARGVKLPEWFAAGDLSRIIYAADGTTNIRVIEGVRLPPAEAGKSGRGTTWQPGWNWSRGFMIKNALRTSCA